MDLEVYQRIVDKGLQSVFEVRVDLGVIDEVVNLLFVEQGEHFYYIFFEFWVAFIESKILGFLGFFTLWRIGRGSPEDLLTCPCTC